MPRVSLFASSAGFPNRLFGKQNVRSGQPAVARLPLGRAYFARAGLYKVARVDQVARVSVEKSSSFECY